MNPFTVNPLPKAITDERVVKLPWGWLIYETNINVLNKMSLRGAKRRSNLNARRLLRNRSQWQCNNI